jgi:hypothetical protein
MDDVSLAKRWKCIDEDAGKKYYRSISKYNINNTMMERNLPLSDDILVHTK